VRDLNFAASSYFLSSLDEGWEVGIKKSGRNFCFYEEIRERERASKGPLLNFKKIKIIYFKKLKFKEV